MYIMHYSYSYNSNILLYIFYYYIRGMRRQILSRELLIFIFLLCFRIILKIFINIILLCIYVIYNNRVNKHDVEEERVVCVCVLFVYYLVCMHTFHSYSE